ncbi:MAG: flagellar basal body protein [Deltaproteobacteria bacterium]|jgi:flagellar basal-body rod protein FlgC|nr:flagellar basal body protein [Deltaproteobacteria bacterium]
MAAILESAASALDAFGVGTQVIANNLANINTDEFQASRTRYGEAPQGQGVRVEEISRESAPGSPLPPDRVDISAAAAEEARAASNVRAEREFVDLIATERAYEANAAVARTYDDMMGTVLDILV